MHFGHSQAPVSSPAVRQNCFCNSSISGSVVSHSINWSIHYVGALSLPIEGIHNCNLPSRLVTTCAASAVAFTFKSSQINPIWNSMIRWCNLKILVRSLHCLPLAVSRRIRIFWSVRRICLFSGFRVIAVSNNDFVILRPLWFCFHNRSAFFDTNIENTIFKTSDPALSRTKSKRMANLWTYLPRLVMHLGGALAQFTKQIYHISWVIIQL